MNIIHVVSCSTGKDSVATLLKAKERFGAHRVVGIICDTGNEHEFVWQHRDYLEQTTGIRIIILTAGFAAEIAEKRMFIARDTRTRREYDTKPVFEVDGKTPVWKRDGRGEIVLNKKGNPVQKTVKVGGGRRVRWTNKAKRRALAHLYPSGNPFLDLCMWKGRFPSRKAQFCTEELKRNMAVSFQIELQEQGYTVVSWQGVRRDESENRKDAKQFEKLGENFYIFRPIVDWTAEDTFDYAASQGIEPNPLYKCGMGRVGCMPCINASKDEIKEIARRWPAHIERIAEWERKVSLCSKRGYSTFFHKVDNQAGQIDSAIFARNKVYEVVEWAKTSRGGAPVLPVRRPGRAKSMLVFLRALRMTAAHNIVGALASGASASIQTVRLQPCVEVENTIVVKLDRLRGLFNRAVLACGKCAGQSLECVRLFLECGLVFCDQFARGFAVDGHITLPILKKAILA